MSWWSVLPVALAAIGLLFVPGALVAWASRVRGVALVAVAPVITVSIVSVSALVAALLNIGWSLLPVFVFTLLMAGIAFGLTRWLVGKNVSKGRALRPEYWWVWAGHVFGVLAAAFLVGRRLVTAFGRPESFSQTFDNVFHLNAVRYILETGSASSMTVSTMTGGGFYPAAWHDIVTLVAATSGAAIPVAVNVVNIVVGSLVWPLGCILLAHTVLGSRVAVSIAAGILSAGFGAFPLLLLDFGVLYPNFLGNAILPVALGLGVQALGLSAIKFESKPVAWLLLVAVLPGLTLAHPSSTMAWLALMMPPLLIVWAGFTARAIRRSPRPPIYVAAMVGLLLVGFGVVALLWKAIRPPEVAAFWPPVETTGRAIGEVLTGSGIGRSVSWAVMALAVAGLVSLLHRRQHPWLLGMFVVAASLFVIVTSWPLGDLRTFYTGVWYNDPPRLASLLPLVTLPLAAVGAVRGWDRLVVPLIVKYTSGDASPASGRTRETRKYATIAAAIVVAGMLTVGTQQANVREATNSAAASYRMGKDSPLISPDEMALLQRLPAEVPEDATMVGNPWNGSSLVYALTGRKLIQLHMLSELPAGADQLYNRLNQAKADPSLCPIVERLHLGYVLDFGHLEIHGEDHGFRGLDNLDASGVATLVDAQGQAKLYKLAVCGQ